MHRRPRGRLKRYRQWGCCKTLLTAVWRAFGVITSKTMPTVAYYTHTRQASRFKIWTYKCEIFNVNPFEVLSLGRFLWVKKVVNLKLNFWTRVSPPMVLTLLTVFSVLFWARFWILRKLLWIISTYRFFSCVIFQVVLRLVWGQNVLCQSGGKGPTLQQSGKFKNKLLHHRNEWTANR